MTNHEDARSPGIRTKNRALPIEQQLGKPPPSHFRRGVGDEVKERGDVIFVLVARSVAPGCYAYSSTGIRYPTPDSVMSSLGRAGSVSSFFLSWAT